MGSSNALLCGPIMTLLGFVDAQRNINALVNTRERKQGGSCERLQVATGGNVDAAVARLLGD